MYVAGPTVNLLNNLAVENEVNSSSSAGGGIWVDASATLYMINNTVSGNTSEDNGGGVAYTIAGTVEVLNVYNNIIWGNSANVNGGDVYLSGTGKERIFSYNDANNIFGVWEVFENDLDSNPKFVAPANGNYHLQSGSPCINTGTTSAPSLPSTDLGGNPRVVAGTVDMGCYEANNSNITLNSPTMSGGLIQIPFTVGVASVSSFHLLQTSQLNGPWTTNTSAVLFTNLSGVSYSFIVSVSGPTGFYRVVSP